MKRRIGTLFLAAALCLCLALPAAAFAPASAEEARRIAPNAFVDEEGGLWTWGGNDSGQVGNGGGGDAEGSWASGEAFPVQTVPVKIMEDVVSVSAGGGQMAAVKTDGTLWMWGDNTYGELGDRSVGDRTDSWGHPYQTVPVQVLDRVAAVDCGSSHTAAIRTDGTLWVWGSNRYGQVGNGGASDWEAWDGTPCQTPPVQVLDDVVSVSCGDSVTVAVRSDGSLWGWGSNWCGILDDTIPRDGDWGECYLTPIKLMDDVAEAAVGFEHIAVVKTDGTLWMWGRLSEGMGPEEGIVMAYDGGYTQTIPTRILDEVVSVACANQFTAAIRADGSLWTWGGNYSGELGNGGGEVGGPVRVLEDVAAVSASCGGATLTSVAALRTDGSVYTWGEGSYGDLGNGRLCDLVLPTPVPAFCDLTACPFADVGEEAYYREAVLWALSRGVTNGTSGDTFSPDAPCTQGQILSFLWRALGCPEPRRVFIDPYQDLPQSAYYARAFRWAYGEGIIPYNVDADTSCTRSDVVTYLWKLAGSPAVAGRTFLDVPAGEDFTQAVAWAVSENITGGTTPTTFSPDGICTRGQIVTFLHRALAE